MADTGGSLLFENGKFAGFDDGVGDALDWSGALESQGFDPDPQVWGRHPDVYATVYEARPDAAPGFGFVVLVKLVTRPYRVYVKGVDGLIGLLSLLAPIFVHHQPGAIFPVDALFGTQGADENPDETSAA